MRGCYADVLLKCREPLTERIDAGVLLLECVNLALLRGKLLLLCGKLLVLRLRPLSEFPCLPGLRL